MIEKAVKIMQLIFNKILNYIILAFLNQES